MTAISSLGLALLVLLLPSASMAKDAPSSYSQSYLVLIKGDVAGSETVTEKTSAAGELVSTSEHEMIVSDGLQTNRMTFSTRMVLAKTTGAPVSYSYWYTSGNTGDSCEVTIANGQATRTLSRGGRTDQVTAPFEPGMVLLDFNVYHHYDYLIRKYDMKKGGRQTFADFIPVIGTDIPIALTLLGESKQEMKNGALPVREFRVEIVGIWSGSMTVDKEGRLVRLLIPTQDIEAVRRDLMPE
jgi:hypothetical protein